MPSGWIAGETGPVDEHLSPYTMTLSCWSALALALASMSFSTSGCGWQRASNARRSHARAVALKGVRRSVSTK